MSAHNFRGNCWDPSVSRFESGPFKGQVNGVCTEHDEPRGDCPECPDCRACVEEAEIEARDA